MNTISNQSPMSRSVKNSMPSRCQGHYEVLPNGKMDIYFGKLRLKYRVNFRTHTVVELAFSEVPQSATRGVPWWAYRLLKTDKLIQIVQSAKPLVTEELPSVRQKIPVINPIVAKSSVEPDKVMTYACSAGGKKIVMVFLKDNCPSNSIVYHVDKNGARLRDRSCGQLYSLSRLESMKNWKKGVLSDFSEICKMLLEQTALAA